MSTLRAILEIKVPWTLLYQFGRPAVGEIANQFLPDTAANRGGTARSKRSCSRRGGARTDASHQSAHCQDLLDLERGIPPTIPETVQVHVWTGSRHSFGEETLPARRP